MSKEHKNYIKLFIGPLKHNKEKVNKYLDF